MLKKAVLAGAVAFGLGLAGAAHAGTVDVWFHAGKGEERELLSSLIENFTAENPGIEINLVLLPEGSYNDQVNAAALSGDLPDLLDFDGPFIANYVWSGFLTPLNGKVDQAIIDDLLPSIVEQGTYPPDGNLYSIGMFDSGLSLWGNKAFLVKAGVRIPEHVGDAWTLAEFEDVLAKLAATEGVKWPLDLKLNYGTGEWFTYGFSPIIQSMGSDLIDRTDWRATGAVDGDGAVKGMQALQKWVNNGWVVPASAGDTNFYSEKNVGLAFVGHWMFTPHTKGLGDDAILIPIPKFGSAHATGMGSWNWGLTESSDDKEDAITFLEYLMQPEQVARWGNEIGSVPARVEALKYAKNFAEGGRLALYVEQLNSIAVPRPFHPAYPTITTAYAEAVNNIIAGGDVEAELKKAAKSIDEDIEDNDGYPPFGG